MPSDRCSTCGYPDVFDYEDLNIQYLMPFQVPWDISSTCGCFYSEREEREIQYENDLADQEYLDSKNMSSTGTGRVRALEPDEQIKKRGGTISKMVYHRPGEMSNRRCDRIVENSTDWMNLGTNYSINKHKRWEVNLNELVEDNQGIDIDVMAVEKAMKPGWDNKVNSVRYYDSDAEEVVCGRVKGAGTSAKNIVQDKCCNGEKKDEMPVPGLFGVRDAPIMVYEVHYPHKNPQILVGKMGPWMRTTLRHNRWNWYGKNRDDKARRGKKNIDMRDHEPIEPEKEVESDEELLPKEYGVDRGEKFTLFDYISAQNAEFVKIQNPNRHLINKRRVSEQNTEADAAAFSVLDFTDYMKTPCQFDSVDADTSKWEDGEFEKQVTTLADSYPTHWLNSAHSRVIVYPRERMDPTVSFPAWKDTAIVFEKQKDSFRMLFNSLHMVNKLKLIGNRDSTGDPNLLRIVFRLVQKIENQIELIKNKPKAKIRPTYYRWKKVKTVVDIPLTWSDYSQGIHSSLLTDKTAPVTYTSSTPSGFEVVQRELSSDSVQLSENEAHQCSECSRTDDLFEMEDHWSCRDCLKKQIIHEMKMMHIPLELKFAQLDGISDLDKLSSLVPITLVGCYVKQVVIPFLKKPGPSHQCPKCGSLSSESEPGTSSYNTVNCWNCKCVWCTKCAMEPHWPMNCEENKKWKTKWDKQYLCRYPPKDISEGSNLLFIRCLCSAENRVIDDWIHANCIGCKKPFNPSTYWDDTSEKTRKEFSGYSIQKKKVQVYICSKYSKHCVEARNKRLNEDSQSSFRAKCARLRPQLKTVQDLPELRMAILHMVEYGMALLSQHRDQPKGLRRKLNRLDTLMTDLEEEIGTVQWSENCILPHRITTLKKTFNKVIDLFKQWQ